MHMRITSVCIPPYMPTCTAREQQASISWYSYRIAPLHHEDLHYIPASCYLSGDWQVWVHWGVGAVENGIIIMISSMDDSDVQCSCQLAASTLCLVLNTIYAGVHRNMRRCIHQMRKRTNDMWSGNQTRTTLTIITSMLKSMASLWKWTHLLTWYKKQWYSRMLERANMITTHNFIISGVNWVCTDL